MPTIISNWPRHSKRCFNGPWTSSPNDPFAIRCSVRRSKNLGNSSMRLEIRKLLLDALEACRSIKERSHGQTFGQYTSDRWYRRAVEREFEIIGEALNRLRRVDATTATRVT